MSVAYDTNRPVDIFFKFTKSARRLARQARVHGRPVVGADLLRYYRDAEAATGVGRNYLAAINLVEATFGGVVGASSADARDPMQFVPATFAHYGDGGDIFAPRDAIMAAGRYLAANGLAADPGLAVFAYNHSERYVQAVSDYAAVIGSDPVAFGGCHRWDVYYHITVVTCCCRSVTPKPHRFRLLLRLRWFRTDAPHLCGGCDFRRPSVVVRSERVPVQLDKFRQQRAPAQIDTRASDRRSANTRPPVIASASATAIPDGTAADPVHGCDWRAGAAQRVVRHIKYRVPVDGPCRRA